MSRLQANLLLLLAGAIWGMGFIAQSTAMDSIGPFMFIALRFALATIVVLPFAISETRKAEQPLQRSDWKGFVWIGLALFAGMSAQQIGLLTTTVTNSGFLTGLYVVFTPILTVLVLRVQPHFIVWPGAVLSITGIYLLSNGNLSDLQTGDFLTILSALFWAIQVMLIGKFGQLSGRPLTLSAVQFAVCTVFGLSTALVVETVNTQAIMAALPEILFTGILASGVAFTLQVIGQRYTTAPQAAIFLSTEALFAALFGALILGDRLTTIGYLGCLLMFSSILLVELVPELKMRKPQIEGGL
jgi:drug/metabolite transporter (DMT)-like permease